MKSISIWPGSRRFPLARSRDKLDSLWDSLSHGKGLLPDDIFSKAKLPSLEVSEDDKEVLVKLEAPGLSEKDLELSYVDGSLLIKGEKKEEKEDRKRNYLYRESWYGSFSRSVPLGKDVDFENAKAEYRGGVLKVKIPKLPGQENRKRIPIG